MYKRFAALLTVLASAALAPAWGAADTPVENSPIFHKMTQVNAHLG